VKESAAIVGTDGVLLPIPDEDVSFEPSRRQIAGVVPAPLSTTVTFDTGTTRGELLFRCREGQGFAVSYPIFDRLSHEAQEVPCTVEGKLISGQKEEHWDGKGLLSAVDLLGSLSAAR
jgi:hypothetical protein